MKEKIFCQNLFESEVLECICGKVARPGGFSLTARAADFCKLRKGTKVLDVGCGAGGSISYLQKHYDLDAMGIDKSENMIEKAHNRYPDIKVYYGTAEEIPIEDEIMEAVFTECSLSKFENSCKALKEFYRVLKSDGWLIISDIYTRSCDKDNILKKVGTGGFMRLHEILSCVESGGFKIMFFEDHTNKLAQLTFDIIMEFGSMQKFWETACESAQCTYSVPGAKLGYYLMVARKV